MLEEIYKLKIGDRLNEEQTKWLLEKMSKISRYRKLALTIDYFKIGYYRKYGRVHKMIYAYRKGKSYSGIPIPKNQLRCNKNPRTRLYERLRKQISYQVEELRKPGYHVDHVYPFSRIVDDWLEERGLTVPRVRSYHYKDFCEYHERVAEYQYLTPQENMSKGNKVNANTI